MPMQTTNWQGHKQAETTGQLCEAKLLFSPYSQQAICFQIKPGSLKMLCVLAHGPQHLKISRTCRKHWKAPEQRSGLQDIEFRSARWTIDW